MGNSIIMLGAYGGLQDKYKYIGNHPDNFGYRGIYRQEWLYMDDNKAWISYTTKHPKSKLTKDEFVKRREHQRNRRPRKGYRRNKNRLDLTAAKRQSDLEYASKEMAQRKTRKPVPNKQNSYRQLSNKAQQKRQKRLTYKRLRKKRYAAYFKENVCSNPLFAEKYFYQEKNNVKVGDTLEFKSRHNCKRNSLFNVAIIKDGTVTIVCRVCHARYHLTYKQILLLQYNAQNSPLKQLK